MSLILNIDTALETAVVCLSKNGNILEASVNADQKDHAVWLHPAIENLLQKTGITLQQLEAISVSIGPGSYTGLRVGLSAAKGFAFALNIPLIGVGTLELMAASVMEKATDLICPVIDARRMEVYTATYDKRLNELAPAAALVIDTSSFSQLFISHSVLFCGSGCKKLETIISGENASFIESLNIVEAIARLSQKYFSENKFADLAYAEPLYIKEFYTTARKD